MVTAPAIAAAIYPSPSDSYAQPLQLVGYLQFTFAGVVIAFLFLGAAAAAIEQALVSTRAYRPSTLLLFVVLGTNVLALVRNASAAAVAVSLIEVLGLWVVARTMEQLHDDPSPQRLAQAYAPHTAR